MTAEEENKELKTLIIDAYKALGEIYRGTQTVAMQVADDLQGGLCDIEDTHLD